MAEKAPVAFESNPNPAPWPDVCEMVWPEIGSSFASFPVTCVLSSATEPPVPLALVSKVSSTGSWPGAISYPLVSSFASINF